MDQYETRTVRLPEGFEAQIAFIAEQGSKGWEFRGTLADEVGLVAVLQRPLGHIYTGRRAER